MDLEYTTNLEPLVIREYGRYIHRMVDHAVKIPDRESRNAAAREIIKVMELLNPDPKKGADHEHKLWDHLHLMAKFQLDVDAPYPKPTESQPLDKARAKPSYPKGGIKYRHYGRLVEEMIRVAKMELNDETQDKMTDFIGAYMKLAYKQWNEKRMSDEIIKHNIKDMSDGRLELDEVIDITEAVLSNTANNLTIGTRPSMVGTGGNMVRKKKKKKKRPNPGQ